TGPSLTEGETEDGRGSVGAGRRTRQGRGGPRRSLVDARPPGSRSAAGSADAAAAAPWSRSSPRSPEARPVSVTGALVSGVPSGLIPSTPRFLPGSPGDAPGPSTRTPPVPRARRHLGRAG